MLTILSLLGLLLLGLAYSATAGRADKPPVDLQDEQFYW